MLPPRVLRTTRRCGTLVWRWSSGSPCLFNHVDGESPRLSVSLISSICIPPVVASSPALDVSAASFRSRGRRPPLVVPRGRCQPPPLKPS
ncbi:hypothetical protein Bca4012_063819 [Brassica carinata]